MEWSEELREAHRGLSEVDFRFRDFARQDPECLSRATYHLFDEELHESIQRLQSWPVFVGREKLEEIRRSSLGLSRLVRSIPERIFGNDPERIARFYDLTKERAELFLAPPNAIASALSRGDFIDSPSGMKCIEFNFVCTLGGWETSLMAALHQRVPATARFLRESGLGFSYTDTVKVLLSHLLEEALSRGLGREGSLNIAMLAGEWRPPAWAAPLLTRELRGALRRRGSPLTGQAVTCSYDDLVTDDRGVWLGGTRIHVALEMYGEGARNAEVYRCFKAGKIVLLNGPVTRFLAGKENLGLLSEHQDSGRFTPEEREILSRHLPWTRIVAPGPVRYRGEEAPLPDLLAARREDFVLKASVSFGGKDVAIGRFLTAAAWDEAVRRALAGESWIVQEYVESRPFLFQSGDYGCAPHSVVWGPFVFGDKYGGVFLRLQPVDIAAPVNVSQSGWAGTVLEV